MPGSVHGRPAGGRLLPFILFLLGAAAPAVLRAQAPVPAAAAAPAASPADTLYEVRLAGGSTLYARVVSADGERLLLETTAGVRVEVARSQLRSMRPAAGRTVQGEFWPEDTHATRLFFGPTGRSLRAGEGYFGVYEIIFPFLSYGVTDRLTLSGGAPILLGSVDFFYLAPKLQVVASPGFQLSLGTLAFMAPRDGGDSETAGVLYGAGTLDGRDRALTLAAGWGFAGDDVASEPVFMLGGEHRVSRRIKLLTENYFMPGNVGELGALVGGGLRFIGDRLSADVGMVGWAGSDEGTACCFPLVNFSYTFGRPRAR